MSLTQQIDLYQFGKSIDILVMPTMIDGQRGVNYVDHSTADYYRAMSDLQTLARQLECAI